MSVNVLLALIDTELFDAMPDSQREAATTALMNEISSDEHLRKRLFDAIEPSVSRMLELSSTEMEK